MRMTLTPKLVSLFLLIGILPAALLGAYVYIDSSDSLKHAAAERLLIARESKKVEISRFLNRVAKQVISQAENGVIQLAMQSFAETFFKVDEQLKDLYAQNKSQWEASLRTRLTYQINHTLNPSSDALERWWPKEDTSRILQSLYIGNNANVMGQKHLLNAASDPSDYTKFHERFHPTLRNFLERFKYYDIFLVEAQKGFVVYSTYKELDFATSLMTGPYRDSGLARTFRAALTTTSADSVVFEDFSPYEPSYNAPAAFIGTPIRINGDNIGVLIFQMPIAEINGIMTNDEGWENAGMGRTGESFLIGPDFTFRSASRPHITDEAAFLEGLNKRGVPRQTLERIKTNKSVIGTLTYKNEHIEQAVAGNTDDGDITKNYLGQPVILSHSSVDLPGGKERWALVSTITTGEAYASLNALTHAMSIAGAVCLTGIILVGLWVARSVSAPLRTVIGVVSTSSSQIAATVNQQERIASQQASSVNETNTTMNELGASSRQSSEQAEAAARSAQNVMTLAQEGLHRMEEMRDGMGNIQTQVRAIAQRIMQLSEQSGQIRDIADLMADFASETKMLAMNAAVEAVRAGEHGKGFTVISVETRKLADESKRSAEKIRTLVEEIQNAVDSTVMVTEQGAKTVENGTALTESTVDTFHKMVDSVDATSANAQQISLNIQQQAIAIKQVVEAMTSINTGAKESASGISQVKTGIQTLNNAAQTLKSMTG